MSRNVAHRRSGHKTSIAPEEGPRFLVDAMLGSLARKLRIFGFDSVYFRDGTDAQLELLARKDGRVILTSDRMLAKNAPAKKIEALLVIGDNDKERLHSLVQEAQIASIKLLPGESRCPDCNGVLKITKRSELVQRIPESVSARHRLFYACLECGKVYWKGGHWSRLRRLSLFMKRTRSHSST